MEFTKFKEGQLVAATSMERLIGACIASKCETTNSLIHQPFPFKLRSYEPGDDDEDLCEGIARHPLGWSMPVRGLKAVVHYDSAAKSFVAQGERAYVTIVEDHYSGLIYKGEPVSTSMVLKHDEATGVFETRNTLYVPRKD